MGESQNEKSAVRYPLAEQSESLKGKGKSSGPRSQVSGPRSQVSGPARRLEVQMRYARGVPHRLLQTDGTAVPETLYAEAKYIISHRSHREVFTDDYIKGNNI